MPASKRVGLIGNPMVARFQFRARNHWTGGRNRTTIKGFCGAGQEDATRTEPFTADSDDPPFLLGETGHPALADTSSALAAYLTGTIVYYAAHGIALNGLETKILGDLDLHGSALARFENGQRPGESGGDQQAAWPGRP